MSVFNHKETGKQAIYLLTSGEETNDPNKVVINTADDLPDVDYTLFDIPPELSKSKASLMSYFSSLLEKETFTVWFLPSGFPDEATPWIKKQ